MLNLMVKKYALLMLGLAAAAGPMAYFHFFDRFKATTPATAADQAGMAQNAGYGTATPLAVGVAGGDLAANIAAPDTPGAPAARLSSVRVQDTSSAFDFQVTPEWIVAHWPAVSTGLAQLQLEGYRVPLVTGTGQQDLAGSLTYYFNAGQKLQQITFLGSTGDPRPLTELLSSRFHLTRRLVNDPGLVVYEAVHDNNQLASSLRIRLAPLDQSSDLYRRYDVELSLVRPE